MNKYAEFGVNPPPREEPILPLQWEPNWGNILNVLPWVFPALAISLMTFTIGTFPALQNQIFGTVHPSRFAFPSLSGFQVICVGVLWFIVLVMRYWWLTSSHSKASSVQIAFWSHFLVGWVLSSILANSIVSFSYSPEDVAFGVPHTFKHLWIYASLLLFVVFLIPWKTITQQEKEN